jgi:hypothetical protein
LPSLLVDRLTVGRLKTAKVSYPYLLNEKFHPGQQMVEELYIVESVVYLQQLTCSMKSSILAGSW